MNLVRAAIGLVPLLFVPLAFVTPAQAATAPFTLIVVPDTQNYTDFSDINTDYNLGQMRWIRDNMTSQNIKFVMHLGDLQNPGNPYRARTDNIYEPDYTRPIGNAAAVDEKETVWARADAGIRVLDNNDIPYSIVPGNHDYLDHNTKSEPWLYLKTFGPTRYTSNPKFDEKGKPTYGGASPANPSNGYAGMDTYHRFSAGGYTFLNLALQYNPDVNDLKWAQQIINENPGLPTILTTHAFVNTKPAANDYQFADIFNDLVKNNPQIVMTFNGHLTGANRVEGTNIAGLKVQQMLVDFQASQLDAQLGADYYRGGGVLRLVQVDPDASRVTIKDYSPIANKYLPSSFTAPDNDGDIATYSTPTGFDLDLKSQFGLPNGAGIKQSKTFQHNVNGYTGGRDTMLDENDPTDASHGSDPTLTVSGDRNGSASGSPDSQVIFRFDFIFDPGNLPSAARIDKAQITLHTNAATPAGNGNTLKVYRLLKPWTVNGSWNSQTDGISLDGTDAILAENDFFVPSLSGEYITLDVTESLATWMAGAPNYGWVIVPGGAKDWVFDTADSATAAYRPKLVVDYTIVPEPASVGLIAGAALLIAGRRRRHRL